MSGRILQSLTSSFDPDEDARPRRNAMKSEAIEAGAFRQFARFTRMPNAADRWPRLSPARRQAWIDEFADGLEGFRAAGGRI